LFYVEHRRDKYATVTTPESARRHDKTTDVDVAFRCPFIGNRTSQTFVVHGAKPDVRAPLEFVQGFMQCRNSIKSNDPCFNRVRDSLECEYFRSDVAMSKVQADD
jgi:hypothetical protein